MLTKYYFSILYRLMKHPKALATLRAEVDATNSSFPMPYSTAHKLPYLTAVIKESLRIHPISGAILLERIVPETGLKVPESNIVLPGGTTVGCTGWTTGFDKRVFGEDAYAFRPERWMKGEKEDEEAFKQRLSMMSSADLSFGKGSRACIGRHVAELELFKLIPTLVGLLDVSVLVFPIRLHAIDQIQHRLNLCRRIKNGMLSTCFSQSKVTWM